MRLDGPHRPMDEEGNPLPVLEVRVLADDGAYGVIRVHENDVSPWPKDWLTAFVHEFNGLQKDMEFLRDRRFAGKEQR